MGLRGWDTWEEARLEAKYRMRRGSVPQTYVQLKKKIGNVMTNK